MFRGVNRFVRSHLTDQQTSCGSDVNMRQWYKSDVNMRQYIRRSITSCLSIIAYVLVWAVIIRHSITELIVLQLTV